MDHVDIVNEIKAKKIRPVYLLHGEESYYIDKISEYIETSVLKPEEKDFNCSIFYGKDSHVQDVIDACRRFPMFSDYQLIIVREAQQLRDLDKLENYVEHIVPTTILVLNYKNGKYDARKKLYKAINQKGIVFESAPVKEAGIPAFIENYVRRRKLHADQKAVNLLVDYLGTDLSRITNELDKLCINIPEGGKITVEEIEKNIGISKDYNVYELQSALLTKNMSHAFTIVNYLNHNSKANPFVLTISSIHAAFLKLYQYLLGGDVNDWELWKTYQIHSSQSGDYKKARTLYQVHRVEEIFELILEYDLRSKGVNNAETATEELLREMVYRILN